MEPPEPSKSVFEQLQNQLIIATLKSGAFCKGVLIGFDGQFLTIRSLKTTRLIAISEITDCKLVEVKNHE